MGESILLGLIFVVAIIWVISEKLIETGLVGHGHHRHHHRRHRRHH